MGHTIGKILGIIAKDAKPVADQAAAVVSVLYPEFAPAAAAADSLVTKIAAEAVKVESLAATAGQATGTGAQKLEAVLQNIGSAIDGWVTSNFPGAKEVSAATKAGLVNAVVAILNEVEGTPIGGSAPAAAASAPAGNVTPISTASPPATGATGAHGAVGDLGSNAPKSS